MQLNYNGFLFLSYRFLKTVQNPKMRTEHSTFLSNNKIIKEKKEIELKKIITLENEDENKERCFK